MSSHWSARTRFLLLALGMLVAVNLGRQLYRWVAFADEREVLGRVMEEVDSAALMVIRTRMLADSLRSSIESADAGLRQDREMLAALERRAENNRLPPMIYEGYRTILDRYNRRVAARNAIFERWRDEVASNHHAVRRYNALADSIRGLGTRMGEPYIAIPTPAEAAARHGLAPGGG